MSVEVPQYVTPFLAFRLQTGRVRDLSYSPTRPGRRLCRISTVAVSVTGRLSALYWPRATPTRQAFVPGKKTGLMLLSRAPRRNQADARELCALPAPRPGIATMPLDRLPTAEAPWRALPRRGLRPFAGEDAVSSGAVRHAACLRKSYA